MPKFVDTLWRSALTSLIMLGVAPAATSAAELSRYRNFQFGTDLPAVVKQAGANPKSR